MGSNELKIKGMSLKATVQVGKSGLNGSIVREIDEQLEKRELVKVKMLRSMGPLKQWKEEVEEMAVRLGATLVEIKGGTVLLHRRGAKKGI
ncbi:MAG: YhbY family RNA-binding protein [Thermoplasmatota archaeon]